MIPILVAIGGPHLVLPMHPAGLTICHDTFSPLSTSLSIDPRRCDLNFDFIVYFKSRSSLDFINIAVRRFGVRLPTVFGFIDLMTPDLLGDSAFVSNSSMIKSCVFSETIQTTLVPVNS